MSFKIAPPTRTRSVVKNRALAAAYAGAHRFGVEVFDPGTANTLMAALLVHDLAAGSPRQEYPWQDEAYAAAHGGLWRAAYDPRSALGPGRPARRRLRPPLTDPPPSWVLRWLPGNHFSTQLDLL